jgi:hypothetical protein
MVKMFGRSFWIECPYDSKRDIAEAFLAHSGMAGRGTAGRTSGRTFGGTSRGARDGALKILKDVLADRFPGLLEEEGLHLDSLNSGYAELNAAVRRLFRADRVEEAREILAGLQ